MLSIVLPFTWTTGTEATPSVSGGSTDQRLATYLRCIITTFASFRRWNPHARLVLATDAELPVPFDAQLQALEVNYLIQTFEHEPPAGFAPKFKTSMFLLDVLAATQQDCGHIVVIDPDLLCLEPLDSVVAAAGESIGAYAIDFYGPDQDINGLTRREAATIHCEVDGWSQPTTVHYGGEFIVIPPAKLDDLVRRCEHGYNSALQNFAAGRPHFVTEEHILSYALAQLPVVNLAPFIRRIWTAPRHRTIRGDESALSLWHLPSEKQRGFARLYAAASNGDSWWWRAGRSEFRDQIGRVVGIPKRGPVRFAHDLARRAGGAVDRTLRPSPR